MWGILNDRSNVHRVVAALAAGRQHVDKFDYALVDEAALRALGLVLQQAAEPCPDQAASNQWHYNLRQLTADDLRVLVDFIKRTGELNRIQGPEVKKLLTTGLDTGQLDEAKVNPKLIESLRPRSTTASAAASKPVPSSTPAPSSSKLKTPSVATRLATLFLRLLRSGLRSVARFLRF